MIVEELSDFKFYVSLGYVVMISSIITILAMQIYKAILKKRKLLTDDMNPDKKDNMLSKAGRISALLVYSAVYLVNEMLIKNEIMIDEALIIGLISGGTTTLVVAKGLYTSLRQKQKKKSIYEKLDDAEKQLKAKEENFIKQNRIILTRGVKTNGTNIT